MARGRAWPWSLGVGWLLAAAAIAPAQEAPGTVPAVAAEREQRVVSSDGAEVSVTISKILLTEGAARVESPGDPDRAGYGEYQLHDFVHGRLYRVFPNDRIYFESPWSRASAEKGFVEGWAPRPDNLSVRMIPLKDDVLDGAPAHLALMERRLETSRAGRYAFIWTSEPPGRLPVRVIFSQAGGQTVIMSYRGVEPRSVDPSIFSVPDGFGNLSPF